MENALFALLTRLCNFQPRAPFPRAASVSFDLLDPLCQLLTLWCARPIFQTRELLHESQPLRIP